MRNFYSVLILSFFLTASALYQKVSAQQEIRKPTAEAVKIDKPFELTGKLDNPAWQKAKPVELNFEFQPSDNTPAQQKTIAYILYDDNNIYFGFRCYDTNSKQIRANISDRDKIWQDDYVGVLIDTYGDYQKAYELFVNPFGIQGDGIATLNNEDMSVDLIWYSAASVNDEGWTAEYKIPFKNLSFPDEEDHIWPLHLIRNLPRESRIINSWMRIERNIPSIIPQSGLMTGIKNIKGGGALELLPYAIGELAGARENFDDPNSKFNYDPLVGRVGGGIKYSPGPNFSLEAVINPDFSQIESDADQIDVNTTFALYYDEKRPFFLTGNDLLETPMYYSRSINNPLAAGRITGKAGNLSFLYLSAYDRNTIIVVPGEERSNTVSTNLNSLANIGRLRYDFGDEIYIGALLLGRNFEDAHNYLVGFDWNYKFWENWYFSGEGFLTQTKEIDDVNLFGNSREFANTGHTAAFDGEDYTGNGLHLYLSHTEQSYDFDIEINTISPTFQTYNGLFSQVGYNEINIDNEFSFYPDSSFIDRWEMEVFGGAKFNFDGIRKDFYIAPSIYFLMKGQTEFNLSYLVVNNEIFNGTYFKNINRIQFYASTRPISELSFYINGSVGKFIYRTSNPKMGYGHNFYTGFTLKPSSKVNISFDYSRARLSDDNTKELFYDGNIYRLISIYQFTSEMFIRLITQYNSFGRSFNVYPLFSYKLNAFTTFYLGATADYLDYNDEIGIRNIQQQYFLKVQYLFGM
ncbi:MAG: sugar-binding protein [Bacteroidota bacterium]